MIFCVNVAQSMYKLLSGLCTFYAILKMTKTKIERFILSVVIPTI